MRMLVFGAILISVLLLGGCWDYQEPDETAWVTAIGVDTGRENVVTVTLQIAVAAQIAGGEGGGGGGGNGAGPSLVVSMEAPSILSAIEMSHAWVSRRVDLSHTRVVIFGRELAETSFDSYLLPLVRHRDFRPTTKVMVTNGRAESLLEGWEPVLENSPARYWTLHTAAWDITEFVPRDGFGLIGADAKLPGGATLTLLVGPQREEEGPPDPTPHPKGAHMAGTIPRRGGVAIDMMGSAVIKGGRMVGVLNGDETGIAKMIRGDFRHTLKTLEDPLHPGQKLVVEVFPRQRPVVDVRRREDGTLRVTVEILLEGDLVSIQSGENYEHPARLELVERAVSESFMRDARAALDKAQNEFRADFFGLGYHVKSQFSTWPEWEAFNWSERFPEADISINVDFRVRRIGMVRETLPLR